MVPSVTTRVLIKWKREAGGSEPKKIFPQLYVCVYILYRASWVTLVVKSHMPTYVFYVGDIRDCRFDSWFGKIPCRGAWQPTPVFLLGESPWIVAWWATIHKVAKNWTCKAT